MAWSGALVLLVAVPGAGSAQDVRIGAHAGVASSTFRTDDGHRLDGYRHGLALGVRVDVGVAGPLRLETGVSWTEKGAEGTVQGFEEPIATQVRLRYLQVPLLLRLDLRSNASLRPSVAVGPAISFEVGCAYEQDPSNVAVVLGCQDPDRARTDWGLIFGGGLAFDAGRAIIIFDARYDVGLRDLDTIDQLRTRNRTFSVSTGLAIPIGR
jgi:hypothetical protein